MRKIVIPLSIVALLIAALFLMFAFSSFPIEILAALQEAPPPPVGTPPSEPIGPIGPPQEAPPPPTGMPGTSEPEAGEVPGAQPSPEEQPETVATIMLVMEAKIVEYCPSISFEPVSAPRRIQFTVAPMTLAQFQQVAPIVREMKEEATRVFEDFNPSDPEFPDPNEVNQLVNNTIENLENEYEDELGGAGLSPEQIPAQMVYAVSEGLLAVMRKFGIPPGGGEIRIIAGGTCEAQEGQVEVTVAGGGFGLGWVGGPGRGIGILLDALGLLDLEEFDRRVMLQQAALAALFKYEFEGLRFEIECSCPAVAVPLKEEPRPTEPSRPEPRTLYPFD